MPGLVPLCDVLDLAVRHLAELPRPTTIVVRPVHHDPSLRTYFTTCPTRYAELVAAGEAVYSPLEYEAILAGLEAGLVSAVDLDRWNILKREAPGGYRVTRKVAGGGVEPSRGRPESEVWVELRAGTGKGVWCRHGWTWGVFFARLGLALDEVVLGECRARDGAA